MTSLWVGTLAWKYDRLMISSTGEYNRVLAAPGSRGQPMHYRGFLAPPNATAVAAWEDPSLFSLEEMRREARASSPSDRIAVVAQNARRTASFLGNFAGIPCLIIAGWVVRRSWRRQRDLPWRPLAVLVTAAAIYPLGYIPVLVTVRYLLFLPILLALAATVLLPGFGSRRWRKCYRRDGPEHRCGPRAGTLPGDTPGARCVVAGNGRQAHSRPRAGRASRRMASGRSRCTSPTAWAAATSGSAGICRRARCLANWHACASTTISPGTRPPRRTDALRGFPGGRRRAGAGVEGLPGFGRGGRRTLT